MSIRSGLTTDDETTEPGSPDSAHADERVGGVAADDSPATEDDEATAAPVPDEGDEGHVGPTERRVQQAIMAVTLAPLVVAAVMLVFGVGNSYLPATDQALAEMQVRDIGRHEVLVGLYSRADWSHPGPALFYLLAPFYWITGGASIGINLGALAINGAAMAGMLTVARRHGGTALMATTALGCALFMRATGAEFVHDAWNCYVTTLPFGLVVMLTWAMMCGSRWALPVALGVASCVAQAHVGFVALALPLAAAGAVVLVARAWRATPAGEGGFLDRAQRTGLVAPVLATGAVLALLWAPMLIDILLNDPSNIHKIIRWFNAEEGGTQTIGSSVRTIVGQFGFEAEWLGGKKFISLGGQSPFFHTAPWPWLLVPVALAWAALWRWGGKGRWLVVTFVVTMALSLAALVRTVGPAFDYRIRWTWIVAVLVMAATVWAGIRAAGHRSRALWTGLVGVVVATLVVFTGINVYTGATAGTPMEGDSDALTAVMPAVLDEVEGVDGQVLVSDVFSTGTWYGRGIVLQLEREGFDSRVPLDQRQLYGEHRVVDGEPEIELMVATNEFVDTVGGDPENRLLIDWTGVSDQSFEEADRELARLDEDLAEGRIAPNEHALGLWLIDMTLANEARSTSYRVAVFVKERRG